MFAIGAATRSTFIRLGRKCGRGRRIFFSPAFLDVNWTLSSLLRTPTTQTRKPFGGRAGVRNDGSIIIPKN